MKFSKLPRIYTTQRIEKKQIIVIEQDNFHYLKSVIRIRKFHTFRLFNSYDGEFEVTVQDINSNNVKIQVGVLLRKVQKETDLELAVCIIKPNRMLDAIKSAVQLGVTRIIPVISQRTQYKKLSRNRIQKCIIQSVQQCERFYIPILEPELTFSDFCNKFQSRQIIIACEFAKENNTIINIHKIEDKFIVLIGPEGGFSTQEIAQINSLNYTRCISLGQTVLRTEVAVSYALAFIKIVASDKVLFQK